jgi:hypothetical protein
MAVSERIRHVTSHSDPVIARDQLVAIRTPLIELHRMLLEDERRRYEGVRGRVSATELLQLALTDEQFAWLHRISTIIVRVDELIASDDLPARSDVDVIAAHIRSVLRPAPDGSPFEQRYDQAVQGDPGVLLAHRRVMQALPPASVTTQETVH